MKKLFSILLLLVLTSGQLNAQYVTIPDANFVTWLQNTYPNCMVGNQMDTTCVPIVTETFVAVNSQGISDLDGIQYFDSLKYLNCFLNNLTTLPSLPDSLIYLNCYGNGLTTLPDLPSGLTTMYCYVNNLTNLPTLPNTLELLKCDQNNLTTLPTLPDSLFNLTCGNNNLSAIPTLPAQLGHLECPNNNISSLPVLPANLLVLKCQNNQITTLPELPLNLNVLHVSYNMIDTLPPVDIGLSSLKATGNGLDYIHNIPAAGLIWLDSNNLTSLPPIPEGIQTILAKSNLITCLPEMPQSMLYPYFEGNPISCLPSYSPAFQNISFYDTIPYCVANDPVINPFGCPSPTGLFGTVKLDTNYNCSMDSTDYNLQNVLVSLFDNANNLVATTHTAQNGTYHFSNSLIGNYTITIDTTTLPFAVNCSNFSNDTSFVIGSTSDSIVTGLDFLLAPDIGFDVGVQSVVQTGLVFPGQQHTLNILAGDLTNWHGLNPGTANGISGTVTISINGQVSYVTSAPNSLPPTVNGLTFTYSIADFGVVNFSSDFGLMFLCDTTMQGGDSICVDITVDPFTGDNDTTNNTFHFCYEAVNSYDPNDKQVYPKLVDPGYDDWLTYTIRFQNTGTAPAFNIRLEDTLSADLNLSTFEVIGYKHTNNFSLYGDRLIVYFPNIMLPDSTTNEPESKGYFQYRVKPVQNLPNGSQVENTAYIFFDYNAPIVTNTAITYFNDGLSFENDISGVQIRVYPNPVITNVFYIESNEDLNGAKLSVYDLSGQQIKFEQQMVDGRIAVELTSPPKGLLIVRIVSDQKVIQSRVVID